MSRPSSHNLSAVRLPPMPPGAQPLLSTAATNTVDTFDYVAESVATVLNMYYTPILIILGVIGNLISIYVFYTTKLRFQSTSLYLSVLAVSDSIFLLQLIPPWLNAMQYTNLFLQPGFCQIFVYSSYVTCCLSGWLVVAFTVERFVAVMYPLRRNIMCTLARAKWIISLLVVFSLVMNLPVIKYASSSINDCNIDNDYIDHAARFNYVDTMISFTMPLLIIVVLNSLIMYGVWQLSAERSEVLRAELGERPRALCGLRPHAPPLPLRSRHRVTRMLLVVSTVYVVLNLPAYVMRVMAYVYNMNVGEYSGRYAAVQQLTHICFHTNFGINFILYCLSGQKFRRALCASFSCCLRRSRRRRAMQLALRNTARVSSITTSCASASDCVGAAAPFREPSEVRRHRSEPVIERWVFNNRGRRAEPAAPAIEMQHFGPAQPLPDVI